MSNDTLRYVGHRRHVPVPSEDFVYFEQPAEGQPVRIGLTRSPKKFRSRRLLALVRGGRKTLRYIRAKLKAHQLDGDLFRPDAAVLSLPNEFHHPLTCNMAKM